MKLKLKNQDLIFSNYKLNQLQSKSAVKPPVNQKLKLKHLQLKEREANVKHTELQFKAETIRTETFSRFKLKILLVWWKKIFKFKICLHVGSIL